MTPSSPEGFWPCIKDFFATIDSFDSVFLGLSVFVYLPARSDSVIESSNDGVIHHRRLVASHLPGIHLSYILLLELPSQCVAASSTNPQRRTHLVSRSARASQQRPNASSSGRKALPTPLPSPVIATLPKVAPRPACDYWICGSSGLDHVPSFSSSLLLLFLFRDRTKTNNQSDQPISLSPKPSHFSTQIAVILLLKDAGRLCTNLYAGTNGSRPSVPPMFFFALLAVDSIA